MDLKIPDNSLWLEFRNGKGETRKGYVVNAKVDGGLHFKAGRDYQLVFLEPGDPDYSDDAIHTDLFENGRYEILLYWRSWQDLADTFDFIPRKRF